MKFLPLLALATTLSIAPAAHAEVRAVVDWTRSTGQVNRALFSTQGFMQVYVEPDPMVMETFELLNPTGTQSRLETYIHQMEPENDNDDPDVFDWDRLYPDKMIRFIEDRAAFEEVYHGTLGMETLSLLCYSVGWLMPNKEGDTVQDIDEWVEFAAAVVESYNGRGEDYRLRNRLVQVWNEPNMGMFYTGSIDSYIELFNRTAARIHRDYPGVLVGGPTITHSGIEPERWMSEFIEKSGPHADYVIFQHYDDQIVRPTALIDAVKEYAAAFRAIPGKERGQIMITETDGRFTGWPKIQYVLQRQFGFLEIRELLLGVQHFCAMAYDESGNYLYGFVNDRGGILGHNFWPYWLFRNYIGNEAHTHLHGPRTPELNLAASFHNPGDRFLGTAVLHNDSNRLMPVETHLFFPPSGDARVLSIDRVGETSAGIESVHRIDAGATKHRLSLELGPGEAVAVHLLDAGQRHFAFKDLNHQELPWIETRTTAETVEYQDRFTLDTTILNTLLEPVSGTLEVRGLPGGWTARLLEGTDRVEGLPFGERQSATFEVVAGALYLGGRVGPYVALSGGDSGADLDRTAHSIPVTVNVVQPLVAQVLPLPVHAVPGEMNMVELQLLNKSSIATEGTVSVEFPEGLTPRNAPETFTLRPGVRQRLQFPFNVAAGLSGTHSGTIHLDLAGSRVSQGFTVEVGRPQIRGAATPVDLTPHLNFDAVAFDENRMDFDAESMGAFVYPGDFTPSGRIVSIRGVPYQMADLSDGRKNVVLPRGQKIPVPPGDYEAVAFMGFGHDGKHPGTWTFHYADGTTTAIPSQIPEWCSPTPAGFSVAFTAPFRYWQTGPAPPACELFTWSLPTVPGKELTHVELPNFERGAYIFAMTLIERE